MENAEFFHIERVENVHKIRESVYLPPIIPI